jgi:hypothetical protein
LKNASTRSLAAGFSIPASAFQTTLIVSPERPGKWSSMSAEARSDSDPLVP